MKSDYIKPVMFLSKNKMQIDNVFDIFSLLDIRESMIAEACIKKKKNHEED